MPQSAQKERCKREPSNEPTDRVHGFWILSFQIFNATTFREFIAPRRKGMGRALSFRPQGEIVLRSLAFARDDGPRPITWRPLRLCASHLFSDSVSQNSTENFKPF